MIVINSRDYLKKTKQRELLDITETGILAEKEIHKLGEPVRGKCPVRSDKNQISPYSNNIGIWYPQNCWKTYKFMLTSAIIIFIKEE